MACTVVTIEQHLRGLVSKYDVPDDTLRSILFQAEASWGMPVSDMDREAVELAEAYLYVWCLNLLPYSKNNTEDSDGGWKHTEGGYQTLDAMRNRWWHFLRLYYRRWHWPWLKDLIEETSTSKVTMINL